MAWGLLPIYWKLLKEIPALEIMLNRWIWAFLFYLAFVFYTKRGTDFKNRLFNVKKWPVLILTAALIGANWYLYIAAVNSGHILQGSLGYYINPILSIFMGALFLKEKLNRAKVISGLLCFIAVVILTISFGEPPWISLILAVTFALYGLLRKISKEEALIHSTVELVFFLPFALFMLAQLRFQSVEPYSLKVWLLVILSGVVTGYPLLWFSRAAQRIPLNAMGFFQYIAPTLQFLCGIVLYGEKINSSQFAAFILIWLGVGIFLFDTYKRTQPLPAHRPV